VTGVYSKGMRSSESRRDVSCTDYLPMTSSDGTHQRDAAAGTVSRSRHRTTDFRMIPSQADCQVKPTCRSAAWHDGCCEL